MKHNQLLINLFWTSLECFNLFWTPLEHSILPLMVIQSAGSPEGWYRSLLPPSHLLALRNSSTWNDKWQHSIKRQAQPKETPSVAFFFCPLYCASGPLRTMAKHVDLCILDSSCWDFSSTLTFAMCRTLYHLLSNVSAALAFADGLWATICFFLLGSGETKKEASYHKNSRTYHDVP